jgi:hypothetical protein
MRKAGDHRCWSVRVLLDRRRPMNLRVKQPSQARPVTPLNSGEDITYRRDLLSHGAPGPGVYGRAHCADRGMKEALPY